MPEQLKDRIVEIVDGKLTNDELNALIEYFRCVLDSSTLQDDEKFFKDLAFEMSGSLKDLVRLIIDFRKNLKSKIDPEITDLTTRHIPQAADQLEGVIETTEQAANKIMDNLEIMQEATDQMHSMVSSLKAGKIYLPSADSDAPPVELDDRTRLELAPLSAYLDRAVQDYMNLVSDTFVQMSFQDLTGQRIKRIMSLVKQMEERLKKMVLSFGIKVAEKEKNPEISARELQAVVAEKETKLVGPQKAGFGLDQAGIDELLAGI